MYKQMCKWNKARSAGMQQIRARELISGNSAGKQDAAAGYWMEIQRQQNNLTQLLLQCHVKQALPQRHLQPFDGNPLQYHTFKRAFQHIIESTTTDYSDKIYFLEQYTRGQAIEIVQSCMFGDQPMQNFMKGQVIIGGKV